MRTDRRSLVAVAAVLLLALAGPLFLSAYTNSQLTLVWTYGLAVLGLNLLTGYSGQISVAQGAFFALGAYTAAICLDRGLLPALLTLPAGALIAGVGGLLLGLPALRVRGLYLAVVTLAVAVALPPVIKRADGLTGGATGLTVDPLTAPSGLGLADDQVIYYLALALLIGGLLLGHRVRSGRSGRALMAVRDRELLATAFGVRVSGVKVQVFVIAAAFGGLAGAMHTLATGFAAPESFTLLLSLNLVIAMVVGGSGGLAGAVLGAAFIVYAPVYAGAVDDAFTGVIYGATLLLFVFFIPGGLASLPGRARRLLERMRPDPARSATPGPPYPFHDRGETSCG